jgi:hypothetical protein
MQFTKDIVVSNCHEIEPCVYAGRNLKNNQTVMIELAAPPAKELLKMGVNNVLKFDRCQSILSNEQGIPMFKAAYVSTLTNNASDKSLSMLCNLKMVYKDQDNHWHPISSVDDIRNAPGAKIQGFITAVKHKEAELVNSIYDIQQIALKNIDKLTSKSYSPKLLIRAYTLDGRDSMAFEIKSARERTESINKHAIDKDTTLNAIAQNQTLNELFQEQSKDKNLMIEVIPAVHMNMSDLSVKKLISDKLLQPGHNNNYGIAKWHFSTFSSFGEDTFVPAVITLGQSPTDERFHFGKSVNPINTKDQKWVLAEIPTNNRSPQQTSELTSIDDPIEDAALSFTP